jgi:acyl-coenzyme A synthetase/AMP-(fatty) acid ligase
MPTTYPEVYARWLQDPERFWAEAAEAVNWYRTWDVVLDDSRRPFYRWFRGGLVNSCHNALDRHVEGGRADQDALIYDSPVTSTVRRLTFRQLRDEVARFAGVLTRLGVGRGDRVIIYMPMVPEAVVGMLACARIGAVHSVVFGGFASHELASRITDAGPKVILSAAHPDVAECAVVGVADDLKGEVPLGLLVLKAGTRRLDHEIVAELVALVRERIGPVASFKVATLVKRLPKTRSGKIVRGTIKKIADGAEYRIPPTIDDPAILDEITADLAAIGYPRRSGAAVSS